MKSDIRTMPSDPDWLPQAKCKGSSINFFPEAHNYVPPEVAEICSSCPVRNECLWWAIDNSIDYGIYGGMSEAARRIIRRKKIRDIA